MTEHFSIATPVLNGMPYLPGCVGSVRGQNGVRTEHLIRDGESNDGTSQWLLAQTGIDAVIERDHGMYDAISRAWNDASGSVLSWLNSDEQYLPGALRTVESAFQSWPDADIVSGNAIIVDPLGAPLAARRDTPLRLSYLRNGPLYTLSCSLFFSRRLLDEGMLKFDLSLRYAADYELLLNLLEAGCRTVHLQHYLSLFIAHDRNLSLHPTMAEEIRIVRDKRGVSKSAAVRRVALMRRYLNKLRTGCYEHRDLEFAFAVDELPTYRQVSGPRVGSSFTWKKAGTPALR